MAILPSVECCALAKSSIVVVGAGACGLTAALAARQGGAEVLVLERDETPFGNTSMSQGTICAAGSRSQAEQGIDDSGKRFFEDIMLQSAGQIDPLLARRIAEQSGLTIDWLVEQHGIPLINNSEWSGFGHSRPRLHYVPTRTGAELHGALMRAIADAGVDMMTGAHVTDLFADTDARVTGVRVRRPDGSHEDIACDALILASSGFGANSEMIERYVPSMVGVLYSGWEGNEGEGILWGMELGAAVADMAAVQNFGALTEPSGIALNFEAFTEGCIQVALDGRRFSNEVEDISGQGNRVAMLPERLSWVLFDERIHQRLQGLPEYSEAVKLGAPKHAPTWLALAALTGLPADALLGTVDEVISLAGTGQADSFGRVLPSGSRFEAPFYAVKVTCALFHTLGGLVVDENAQVLREDGTHLPNLFAGGGAARNIAGPTSSGYLPGSGLCVAITLGRLAGAAAARLLQV